MSPYFSTGKFDSEALRTSFPDQKYRPQRQSGVQKNSRPENNARKAFAEARDQQKDDEANVVEEQGQDQPD